MNDANRSEDMGPLQGIKIVELAGIGPAPFCAMGLADLGAEVIRVDRASSVSGSQAAEPDLDLLNRSRKSVAVDLKHPEGVETVLRLADKSDAFIEDQILRYSANPVQALTYKIGEQVILYLKKEFMKKNL